jgi:two-component system nitrogen regulation response regulator GlnG
MKRDIHREKEKFVLRELIKEFEEPSINTDHSDLYRFILQAVERPLIEVVLEKTYGNQLKAAKILGINRNTLHSKIKKLGIEVSKWRRN